MSFERLFSLTVNSFQMMRARLASGLEGKLSPDSVGRCSERGDELRLAAEKLPLEPHEHAQSSVESRECCQQVPMGVGDLLLFRCALPVRGFQRELPPTITNGQKLVLIPQKNIPRLPG